MTWPGRAVVVAGLGVSGVASAEVLLRLGADVTVVDAKPDAGTRGAALEALGAKVFSGSDDPDVDADLVVTSPGWRPDQPYLARMAARGVPVWGEVELALRLRGPGTRLYAVTGTNGKTTTTEMLGAILATTGRDTAVAGNIGTPLVEVLTRDPAPDLVAVELSSFQLHWTEQRPWDAAAILNVAPDHLDWHGSFDAYLADKLKVWGPATVRVYNGGDPALAALARPEDVDFTTVAVPGDLRVRGPHNVANARAAAALGRLAGASDDGIGAALRAFKTGAHRLAVVAEVGGVTYVDDSKATNPHAAQRAVESYPSVVWVAGGLNKGLGFDDLVVAVRDRLRAAVLIGSCAGELHDALRRNAPEVPVERADAMHTAVEAARRLARPGDTVLLAPAAASMDMFRDYGERGDRFAAAVRALEGEARQ